MMALNAKEREAIRSLVEQEIRQVLAAALAQMKEQGPKMTGANGTGYPPARPPALGGVRAAASTLAADSTRGTVGEKATKKLAGQGKDRRPLARPKKITPAQAGVEKSNDSDGTSGEASDLQRLAATLRDVREQLVRQLDEAIQRLETVAKAIGCPPQTPRSLPLALKSRPASPARGKADGPFPLPTGADRWD